MKWRRFWPDTLFTRIFLLIGGLLLASQGAVYWYFNIYLGNPQAQHMAQNWAQVLTLSSTLDVGEAEWLAPRLAQIGIEFYPVHDMRGKVPNNPIFHNAIRMLHSMGWPQAVVRLDNRRHLLWLYPDPRSHVAVALPLSKPPGPPPQWIKLGAIALLSLLGALLIVRQITRPLSRLIHGVLAARDTEGPVALPVEGPADLQRLTERLNEALQDLNELWRDREMVLVGVSHDLRTPLTRMRMLLEFLPPEADDTRDDLIHNLREMDQILRQFLDYARSGREEAAQALSLGPWLEDFIQHQGTGVSLGEAPMRPLTVYLAPVALSRVLQNLVENARRHAATPIVIGVAQHRDRVEIQVRDHGPGIAESLLPDLGKPFALAGRGGGTGLGLAIVQRILRRYGGRLVFENAPDGGAIARILLPLTVLRPTLPLGTSGEDPALPGD